MKIFIAKISSGDNEIVGAYSTLRAAEEEIESLTRYLSSFKHTLDIYEVIVDSDIGDVAEWVESYAWDSRSNAYTAYQYEQDR